MKTVEIFSTIEIKFQFISVEIFKIETFQSRLGCVKIFIEIVETNRDFRDFRDFRDKSRFFEIFVGNRDFVEINRDFVEINRDFVEINRDFVEKNRDFFLQNLLKKKRRASKLFRSKNDNNTFC